MATLNFNAANVDPQQSFDPLPAGWYAVQMTASEMKPTKDSATTGNAYLEAELTVLEPPYLNRKIFYRLNLKNNNQVAQEIAYKQLSAICHAVGVIQVEDSRQLHGLPFKVKVSVNTDPTGKYDPSNEVKAIKGINEGTGAPAPAPMGFGAPAASGLSAPAPAPMGFQPPPAAPQQGAPSPAAFAPQQPAAGAPAMGGLPPWMQKQQGQS